MRRAMRFILNVLTGLSLVLAIIVVTFKAYVGRYAYMREVGRLTVLSAGDTLIVGYDWPSRREATWERPYRWWAFNREAYGFNGRWYGDQTHTRIYAPMWWVISASSALPALKLSAVLNRLRKRRGPHACRACGYDIRATPERCPECGTSPVQAATDDA